MSKAGRRQINNRFELYIWAMVELFRDQDPRREVSRACRKLIKKLEVDWPLGTMRTHYYQGKTLAKAEPDDSARLIAALRGDRERSGITDPISLVVKMDSAAVRGMIILSTRGESALR